MPMREIVYKCQRVMLYLPRFTGKHGPLILPRIRPNCIKVPHHVGSVTMPRRHALQQRRCFRERPNEVRA